LRDILSFFREGRSAKERRYGRDNQEFLHQIVSMRSPESLTE